MGDLAWQLRFADVWHKPMDMETVAKWMEDVIRDHSHASAVWKAYRTAFREMSAQMEAEGYRLLIVHTKLSLMVGLGDAHLSAAGITCTHPLWGAPVIPAEALKGMTRADVRERLGVADVEAIFGSTSASAQLEFAEGWWMHPEDVQRLGFASHLQPGPFVRETIGPGEAEYHRLMGAGGSVPGLARYSSAVVPVLAAQGSFALWFRAAQRVPADEVGDWLELGQEALGAAIEHRGVGGWTNIDWYGRLEPAVRPPGP